MVSGRCGSSGLRTATDGLYDNDFGTSVSGPVSGPTQQFANDKMKLKIVDNTKHSDAEENTETFLELKTGRMARERQMANMTLRSAMKLQKKKKNIVVIIIICVYMYV